MQGTKTQADSPQGHAPAITAALLIIGDEILSGRTKDKNIGTIAEYLGQIGIDLGEVRIVPDKRAQIIAALNALRARYTYLFTTGGIGPTHDDITAECVAEAFGVALPINPEARAMLVERHGAHALNEARLRMARIPEGAKLIPNRISKAPGFWLDNVIVMAGVPMIMQAMLDEIGPQLQTGITVLSLAIPTDGLPEGVYATGLGKIAEDFSSLSIGSYPSFADNKFTNQIVLRGRDQALLKAAHAQIIALLATLSADSASL